MEEAVSVNGAAAAPTNGQAGHAGVASSFGADRLRELIAALGKPFDPAHIKWRVTNTVTTGSRLAEERVKWASRQIVTQARM